MISTMPTLNRRSGVSPSGITPKCAGYEPIGIAHLRGREIFARTCQVRLDKAELRFSARSTLREFPFQNVHAALGQRDP